MNMFRSGMPDLRVAIDDMIAEGDKVATRYTMEGTHEGELFGVPPTGQQLSIKSIRWSGCRAARSGSTGESPTPWI